MGGVGYMLIPPVSCLVGPKEKFRVFYVTQKFTGDSTEIVESQFLRGKKAKESLTYSIFDVSIILVNLRHITNF